MPVASIRTLRRSEPFQGHPPSKHTPLYVLRLPQACAAFSSGHPPTSHHFTLRPSQPTPSWESRAAHLASRAAATPQQGSGQRAAGNRQASNGTYVRQKHESSPDSAAQAETRNLEPKLVATQASIFQVVASIASASHPPGSSCPQLLRFPLLQLLQTAFSLILILLFFGDFFFATGSSLVCPTKKKADGIRSASSVQTPSFPEPPTCNWQRRTSLGSAPVSRTRFG